MNSWHIPPPDPLQTIFTTLKEELPRLGSYWLNCLQRGYTASQLATEIAIDLRQEERQAQKKLDDSQQALRQHEEQSEQQIQTLRSQLNAESLLRKERERTIVELNRIIAQQQGQLNTLLGNEPNEKESK